MLCKKALGCWTVAAMVVLGGGCDDTESKDTPDVGFDTIIDRGDTSLSDTGSPQDTGSAQDTGGGQDTAVPPQDTRVAPDTSTGEAPRRSCITEVVFTGNASTSVHIAGSFNAWDPTADALTQDGGAWRIGLNLTPGSYPYKFVIDGPTGWETVPDTTYTQWDGDQENRSLRVGNCNAPQWDVVASPSFDENGVLTAELQFVSAAGGALIDPGSVTVTVGGEAVTPSVDAATGRVNVSYTATDHGKYSLRVSGTDTEGVAAENNTFYLPLWYEARDFDWRDATLYLIFTDRFRDSDGVDQRIAGVEEQANYLGGDFYGITQAIEEGYFDEMGVNAIWFSPIYDNPEQGYRDKRDDTKLMSGFHGYWPISLEPEPRYGDTGGDAETRLKELIETAHAHGIRILFDLALNHVHESHTYCNNPGWCDLTCQCGSAGCGWDPSERGLDCQFDYFLPDLSYRNHNIVEQVIADTLAMADEYDIDGMRIDAARHMDHVIMRNLRLTLRDTLEEKGGAPYYLVGETFTDDRGQIMDYVSDYELHGQFDFAMRSAIRYVFGTFANNGWGGPIEALEEAAAASEAPSGYGDFVWSMSPFFGNHDIPRFATEIAAGLGTAADEGPWGNSRDLMDEGPDDTITQWEMINRITLSYAFLLAYKGVPLLYYGDEIGLAGSADPDNRRMMHDVKTLNANQRELLQRVRALGKARRDIQSLRRGERRELWKDNTLYVFTRYMGPGEAAIIAMVKGDTPRTETITIPAELGLDGLTLQSYTSDKTATISGGTLNLSLNGWEYAVFHTAL